MTDLIVPLVDRAAFGVALGARLRATGLPVGLTGIDALVRALEIAPPTSRSGLYWTARITLVRAQAELAVFDAVFNALFGDSGLDLDPHARRSGLPSPGDQVEQNAALAGQASVDNDQGGGLPWVTRPRALTESDDSTSQILVPLRLPSHLEERADEPFEQLTRLETDQLGLWLTSAVRTWPTRPGRRWKAGRKGRRIILRSTLERARRTGWEPVRLVRGARRPKPRRVVMLCDVSRSMQAQATAYLHLMRGLALATDAETFAFATRLTRLTAVLRTRSAQASLTAATDLVTDRFGGTRIATSIESLLASRHGDYLRGAIVIVGSDGWDGDPPERLARAMERLRRRARRVIWMNPRASAPGFEPTVATMAAALPFCDVFLPAATFRGLADVLAVIGRLDSGGLSSRGLSSRGLSSRGLSSRGLNSRV